MTTRRMGGGGVEVKGLMGEQTSEFGRNRILR